MSDYKTYALGNNSVINWRKSIDRYYKKGLPAFSDASTIRHMLRFTIDFLEKDEAMVKSVLEAAGEKEAEEFAAAFADERAAMEGIRAELEEWLSERRLGM